MQLWRTIIDAKGGNYAIMKSQKCNYATVLEPWFRTLKNYVERIEYQMDPLELPQTNMSE